MIPEITITCSRERLFLNSVSVGQYRKYAVLMEKNSSDKSRDIMFFNRKIVQEMFKNRISLEELGKADIVEFITAAKGIHFIMQDIIMEKLLGILQAEPVEEEKSAFDEYDIENGYEEEQPEQNVWKTCVEIIDRIVKIAIRLLQNSYSQCMGEDIVDLLEYLQFELDTLEENQA